MEENTKIEIEKGVEMPNQGLGIRKYPFPDMEVTDSFIVKAESNVIRKLYSQISASKTHYLSTEGGKGKMFSVRKVEGGIRVWRIS